MKEIETIYNNFQALNEDYADLPETDAAYKALDDFIEHSGIFGNAGISQRGIQMYDLISEYGSNCEKQGFLYGFNYAVTLLTGGKQVWE